jgi:hypothetical protein
MLLRSHRYGQPADFGYLPPHHQQSQQQHPSQQEQQLQYSAQLRQLEQQQQQQQQLILQSMILQQHSQQSAAAEAQRRLAAGHAPPPSYGGAAADPANHMIPPLHPNSADTMPPPPVPHSGGSGHNRTGSGNWAQHLQSFISPNGAAEADMNGGAALGGDKFDIMSSLGTLATLSASSTAPVSTSNSPTLTGLVGNLQDDTALALLENFTNGAGDAGGVGSGSASGANSGNNSGVNTPPGGVSAGGSGPGGFETVAPKVAH